MRGRLLESASASVQNRALVKMGNSACSVTKPHSGRASGTLLALIIALHRVDATPLNAPRASQNGNFANYRAHVAFGPPASTMAVGSLASPDQIGTRHKGIHMIVPAASRKVAPRVGTTSRTFRAHLAAYQLLDDLKHTHVGRKIRMLDVGGSHGVHARFFRAAGLHVDVLDMVPGDEQLVFEGDFLDFTHDRPYDVVWASHVLEHVRNVGIFLDKMFDDIGEDGYMVSTVPPIREHRMAYNHVSFWNPGMLLLNAGLAGFDVPSARLATYNYNVSIIARKSNITPADISEVIPSKLRISNRHFRGNIKYHNWPLIGVRNSLPIRKDIFSSKDEAARSARPCEFFYVLSDEGKRRLHYLDGQTVIPVR